MKAVFLLAILCGFGGTLAAAHFAPWLAHARLPSHTTVVANGGRAESFFIRRPADRIAATNGEAGGLRAAGSAAAMPLPAELAAEPLLVEHFKVRDAAGNVIGVAARHWTGSAGAPATTWSVLIPSRGSLVLSAPGEARGALDAALRGRGHREGQAWTGNLEVPMVRQADGAVSAGTGEFAGLTGQYSETWTVAAVEADGKVSGTIEIATTTSRPE